MLARLLTGLTILLSLQGCGPSTKEIDDWCGLDSPIMVSRHDILTPGTARQILAHNDVGSKKCGW
jgi:hypothetical protein